MQSRPIDICVIEDDPEQRRLLVSQLVQWGHRVVEADCGEAGLRSIYEHQPRIAICDIVLPDINGIEICERVRADTSLDNLHLLLLTAYDDHDRRTKAFAAGADDYLRKPYDADQLQARIRTGLRLHRLQERLQHAAITDGLTGLWNHSHLRASVEREHMRVRRYGGRVALLMIDLDHFKAVNDTYGHEAGNRVLKMTARHLEHSVRETDLLARYGGEEFAVICPETSLEEATQLAERIRRTVSQAVRLPEHPQLVVRTSCGVATSEDPRVQSAQDLVNLADQALYCSKRGGRNRVTACTTSLNLAQMPELHADELDRLRKENVALSMQSKELCLQSVWALIQALEARDGYSAWHSRNVTLYAKWLVDDAAWPRPLRVATTNAAMLHDLGKIGVPDSMLLKPRPMDAREAAMIRQVPLITCKILEPLRVFETEIVIIRHLRERWDGAGFPEGLSEQDIPIGSRLLAVAEAFDSITCNRAYRMGRSKDEALSILRADSGTQFDPEFVDLIDRCVRKNPNRWQNQIEKARIEMPLDAPVATLV